MRRTLALLFLVSFVLNLVLLLIDVSKPHQLPLFRGEEPRIAWSIATGQGFSSPFWKLTGPTAWSPPLQPYLMSAVFRAWGLSIVSEFLVQAVNIIFFAATAVLLSLLGKRVFGERTGLIAGWCWALIPPAVAIIEPFFGNLPFRPTWVFLWDASLATLLLAALLLATVSIDAEHGLGAYALYGALWGISSLANPAVLALLPVCLYFVAQPVRNRRKILIVAAIAATFLLTCSPWLIRNYLVFRRPVFIRSNFGVEFRVGNVPGSDGTWNSANEPSFSEVEWPDSPPWEKSDIRHSAFGRQSQESSKPRYVLLLSP